MCVAARVPRSGADTYTTLRVDVVAIGPRRFALAAHLLLRNRLGCVPATRVVFSTRRMGAANQTACACTMYALVFARADSHGCSYTLRHYAPRAQRSERAPHCQFGAPAYGLWAIDQRAATGCIGCPELQAAQQSPRIFGAAMPSIHAVYARLKAYKQRFQGRWPRLYMVRADIRAAFDSLDHTRLLHLVRALVPRHATYVLQRHAQIRPGIGMIRRTQVRRAWPAPHPPSFLEQNAEQSAPPPRHAVLVDGVTYTCLLYTSPSPRES